jgi:hypothetical protein
VIAPFARRLARLSLAALLALGACGRVKAPSADGGGGDGDGGGGEPDGATEPGEVRVTVLGTGNRRPLLGVPVAFFAPDGALATTVLTDAEGVAAADVASGSAVVAFIGDQDPSGPAREARAVLAVQPGDDIVLAGLRFPVQPALNTVRMTLPGQPDASFYFAHNACGFFSLQQSAAADIVVGSLEFYAGCQPDPFAFVAIAQGDSGPLASIVSRGNALNSVEVSSAGPWKPLVRVGVSMSQIPPEAGRLTATLAGISVDGQGLSVGLGASSADIVADTERRDVLHVADADDSSLLLELTPRSNGGSGLQFGSQRYVVRRTGTADLDLSGAALALPWVGSVAYDSDTGSFFWTQVGDAAWDASYLDLLWQKIEGNNATFGIWSVVTPPGSSRADLPPIPAQFADWLPEGLQPVGVNATLMESSELAGYGEARQRGLDPRRVGTPDALTELGTVRYSSGPASRFTPQ